MRQLLNTITPAAPAASLVTAMPVEAQLLLSTARTRLNAGERTHIRHLLRQPIDWTQVRALARRHGTLPLLFTNLEATYPKAVPAAVMEALHHDFCANAWRNLTHTGELLSLLALLWAEEIRAIPYKGPALARRFYGNVAYRHFAGLDILVHQADVLAAKRVFSAHGYEQQSHLADEPPALEDGCKFVHPAQDTVVELHGSVTSGSISFPLDFDCLWSRVQPVSLGGTTVFTLPLEELLLVLCIHGYRHKWQFLKWICDVNELVGAGDNLEWEHLLQQAERLGSKHTLFLGLRLSRDLLGATIPGWLHDALESTQLATPVDQIVHRLFTATPGAEEETDKLITYLETRGRLQDRYLETRERPQDRVKHFGYVVRARLKETLSIISYLTRRSRLS